jgi:transposase
MSNNISLGNHDTLSDLERFLKKKNDDEQQKTRVRAIVSIKKGILKQDIAKQLVVHIDTITDWVKRYNERGVSGLKTNKGGRKEGNPKWDTEIFTELVKEIDKQDRYWSLPIMMDWIKSRYKKEIPLQTVWYHVDKRAYSYKSSRPHPYLGNKEKQESFKKGAWVKS